MRHLAVHFSVGRHGCGIPPLRGGALRHARFFPHRAAASFLPISLRLAFDVFSQRGDGLARSFASFAWRQRLASRGTAALRPNARKTIADLAEIIRNDYRANKRPSLWRLEDALGHLLPVFGPRRAVNSRVLRLQPTSFNGSPRAPRTGPSIPSWARSIACTRSPARQSWLPACRTFRSSKKRNTRQGFFERDQYEAVRRHLPPDLQAVVAIAHTFGWRGRSEVLTLERRQLDLGRDAGEFGTPRLDPHTTKNGDGQVVHLTPELRGLLAAQLERVRELERKLGRVVPYPFPHFGGYRKESVQPERAARRDTAEGLP